MHRNHNLSFLENPVIGEYVRHSVSNHDQNEADYRLEHTYSRSEAVITTQKSDPVYIGIDDVAFSINERIVQIEDLVKSRIQNAAQ